MAGWKNNKMIGILAALVVIVAIGLMVTMLTKGQGGPRVDKEKIEQELRALNEATL